MIRITQSAANELRRLLAEKAASAETGLRLSVERGGCAGLQYSMKLETAAEGDVIIARDGVNFILGQDSVPYLQGSEIDYEDSLNDSGFKIHNPNAARSCGCGTSFEPAVPAAGAVQPAPPVPLGQECGAT